MSEDTAIEVFSVDCLALSVDATKWKFAIQRRREIDALFTELQSAKPALFNGQVLLMHDYAIVDGIMRGKFLQSDYASFAAWQRWGRPPARIYDCFGSAAILSADGAFLLGEMGVHTFNAGHIYFPCGVPDPSDIRSDGMLDLDFSVRRELFEETGLGADSLVAEPGWTIIVDGALVAVIKVFRSEMSAVPLRNLILQNLTREQQPEFSNIRVVRSVDDFDPMMRGFVKKFMTQRFARA